MNPNGNITNYVTMSKTVASFSYGYDKTKLLRLLAFVRAYPAVGADNILARRKVLDNIETWLYSRYGMPLCVADVLAGNVKELPIWKHGKIQRLSENIDPAPDMNRLRFIKDHGLLDESYPHSDERYPISFAKILN